MGNKTKLVVIDTKEKTLSRYVGKNRTHKAKTDDLANEHIAETVELFRKNPDYLLDIDDPEEPTAA